MRTIHSLAQFVEEMSREEESSSPKPWYSHCIRWCIVSSLADHLISPIKNIIYGPVIALIVVLVLYLLFLIIFTPLWLLSFLVTSYGSLALLLLMFHYLAIYITRFIAFPGSNISTQQQISADMMRRVSSYLDNIASSTNNACAILLLITSNQLAVAELQNIQAELRSIWLSAQYLPNIQYGLKYAVDSVKRDKILSALENNHLATLLGHIDDFANTLNALLNTITQNEVNRLNERTFSLRLHKDLSTTPTHSHSSSAASSYQSALLQSAGKCLAASECLRISSHVLVPQRNAEEESGGGEGLLLLLKPLLFSCFQKVTSYETLSFPFMRALLIRNYDAKIFTVQGSGGQSIDCLFISSRGEIKSRKHVPPSNATENKLVFFCSPNAGFYELFSQCDWDSSWCGTYLSRGYDFFTFNYRGYGRSEGSPSPAQIQADALCVFRYVQSHYPNRLYLVHGESIGGMVACHVAKQFGGQIGGLVCDRTFSSLDAAARRILAQWAGQAMKYLAFWQTNEVENYLAATCPKLILQDPKDGIIAHTASLKVGVAKRVLLEATSMHVVTDSADYAYARYLNQLPLPHSAMTSTWLNQDLSYNLVEHLFAAYSYLAFQYHEQKGQEKQKRYQGEENLEQEQQERDSEGEEGRETNIRLLARRLESKEPSPSKHISTLTHARVESSGRLYSISVRDLKLSNQCKAFLLISRIQGSGQILNHGFVGGLDSAIAWVSSYIVWLHNKEVHCSAASLLHNVEALKVLLAEQYDELIDFLVKALEYIHKEHEKHSTSIKDRGDSRDVESKGETTPQASYHNMSSPYGDTQSFSKSNIIRCREKTFSVGQLITLHCGHNGWPNKEEMQVISHWMDQIEKNASSL